MPLPITPTPARPVDDGIIETGWGTWAHDLLLAMPRGVVAMGNAPGVAFATLTPDQFSKVFPAQAGRLYLIYCFAQWRSDVAGSVASFQPWVNGAALTSLRDTNAIAAGSTSTNTAQSLLHWAAPADIPACSLRMASSRQGGTGTITPATWSWSVTDVGPSAGIPAVLLQQLARAATVDEQPEAGQQAD